MKTKIKLINKWKYPKKEETNFNMLYFGHRMYKELIRDLNGVSLPVNDYLIFILQFLNFHIEIKFDFLKVNKTTLHLTWGDYIQFNKFDGEVVVYKYGSEIFRETWKNGEIINRTGENGFVEEWKKTLK